MQTEGTQDFTLTQKNTETPNIAGENKLMAGQDSQQAPEKNVRESSEGGHKEMRVDEYRINSSLNNEDGVAYDIP